MCNFFHRKCIIIICFWKR